MKSWTEINHCESSLCLQIDQQDQVVILADLVDNINHSFVDRCSRCQSLGCIVLSDHCHIARMLMCEVLKREHRVSVNIMRQYLLHDQNCMIEMWDIIYRMLPENVY